MSRLLPRGRHCLLVTRQQNQLRGPIQCHTRCLSSISSRSASISSEITTTARNFPVNSFNYADEPEFWRDVPVYRDIDRDQFLNWDWAKLVRRSRIEPSDPLLIILSGLQKLVEASAKGAKKLWDFLDAVLPEEIPQYMNPNRTVSRDEFMTDIWDGMKKSNMSMRATPYVMSRIDWKDPANDPVFRQFLPLKSWTLPEHPKIKDIDSLGEEADTPVDGIVHRYPDKCLFLPISVCPTYCQYCTRAREVGLSTDTVIKAGFKPKPERLRAALDYIEGQPGIRDVVVSGGDLFYLPADAMEGIADRLLRMRNVERFRFATKGLAVAPNRFLTDHAWTDALVRVSDRARAAGKHMALHTHFNHPNEVSWITELASRKLMQSGVTVRNQTVLLRGVNDDVETMGRLIQMLAKMVIQPYYIYQCDMVPQVEHLRTPLSAALALESGLRGRVAGFYTPAVVVDLPGGGGKQLACNYRSYDPATGVSTFVAPTLEGSDRRKQGRVYTYYDPVPDGGREEKQEGRPAASPAASRWACGRPLFDVRGRERRG
ncbi:kama family protein [Xylariomycetidae sp. FL0641]|nr:kama family protein [Xylariomycetidae sp. FL0641]